MPTTSTCESELGALHMARSCIVQVTELLREPYRWTMHTIDVTTAYLNAKLDEPEYVIMPVHCRDHPKRTIIEVVMAAYGLIIAPKTWYREVKRFFTQTCEMQKSQRDPALFYKGTGEDAADTSTETNPRRDHARDENLLTE